MHDLMLLADLLPSHTLCAREAELFVVVTYLDRINTPALLGDPAIFFN